MSDIFNLPDIEPEDYDVAMEPVATEPEDEVDE